MRLFTMKIETFDVIANIPKKLNPLRELASNLWFSWHFPVIELFKRLDPDIWELASYNPKYMLNLVPQKTLDKAAADESFLSYMNEIYAEYKNYLKNGQWFKNQYPKFKNQTIAYFSMEFGLDESLPIYSGGLGILAGDHLKAASDLNIPLVGIGFLYQQGYFKQYLNSDGWQQESYPENKFFHMPINLVIDEKEKPVTIEVEYLSKKVYAQIWECLVGRNKLFLLDTNIPQNNAQDKLITAQLYGGNTEMRIKQEILIGIGGIKALYKLNYNPSVFHMNEGHSVFLSLERIRHLIERKNLSLKEAFNLIKATNVFTTHTPVAAGNDRFEQNLITKYLEKTLAKIGLSEKQFQELGKENPADEKELFCLTVLALKTSTFCNGVSKLHSSVSRQMWQNVWPLLPKEEIPIKTVTNGIHVRSWVSHDLADLFNRYLGPNWGKTPDLKDTWERIDNIPDIELWGTHERRRERLVSFARKKLTTQLEQKGALSSELEKAKEILNPKALTIGFAKRFATYKRATLIFKDLERLFQILSNEKCPVQFIFAGKAHPLDNPGKKLIQDIFHYTKLKEFNNKIIFLEDYDLSLSRYLVQGCDVWLNTPRRPLEASGTSGMKAAANGVLNLSILDGWWCEGYNYQNGWAIGQGEEYNNLETQNYIESNQLYNLLEEEIIPLFYKKQVDGIPREWVNKMKECIKSISPYFNTNRMVSEYCAKSYIPAYKLASKLEENNYKALKELTVFKEKLKKEWSEIKILKLNSDSPPHLKVGDTISIRAEIQIGNLSPQDIKAELFFGLINSKGKIQNPETQEMHQEKEKNIYTCKISCKQSGHYGYTARIIPKNELLPKASEPELIAWQT
jgi:glycogen phosphorylase